MRKIEIFAISLAMLFLESIMKNGMMRNIQLKTKTRKTQAAILTTLIIMGLLISAFPMFISKTQAANPVSDSSFSIIQISDTQHLAILSPILYNDTTSWIVNNSASYNLKMVVHTGDFIDQPNLNASQWANEWANANAAMIKLLNAGIPYSWGAGNHDQTPFYNPNGTMMGSSYSAFNTTIMRSKSYWVDDIYDAKNTAVKFTYNNYPFLIVNLENFANNSAITWMKGLLDKNTGANVIVTTHSYLNAQANYDFSSPVITSWNKALKATLDSYPNVFLALSGHIAGWNMTRAGNRQEILFDRQETNNQKGAAAVRIYTFNLANKKVNASTYSIDTQTWLTDAFNQFSFDASLTSDWTLIYDARSVKAYPDLREYVWQKDARMPPNGQYDKIALHRFVKTGTEAKGVVFFLPGTYGNGEQYSNPPGDNWTWNESYNQPIYWANRGFDVYTIDYRTHFVPSNLNVSQLSFMADWGWDQWISDIKETVNKAKDVSGAAKVFLAGHSFGGMASMNYATKYGLEDLRGIILLDGGNATVGKITNSYNLSATMNTMLTSKAWASDFPTLYGAPASPPGLIFRFKYAFLNPGAPAEYPPGTPLLPKINPITNMTWANITEYHAVTSNTQMSNIQGGYADIMVTLQNLATCDRYWPVRLSLELAALRDWNNCPYVSYDFDDYYRDINVPLIGFTSELRNLPRDGPVVKGIANPDVTSVVLLKYGHNDVIKGIYSARDVSQPTLDWMVNHLPSPLTTSVTQTSSAVTAGNIVSFYASVSGGVAPYTYQWYQGTSPVGNSAQLSFYPSNAGTYSYTCKITDAEGKTTNSNPATLTVNPPSTPAPAATSSPPTTTPTPQIMLSPAPTATASPSPAPSASPSQSPSPTPQPTATPSPIATPNNSTLALPTEATIAIAAIMAFVAIVAVVLILKKRAK